MRFLLNLILVFYCTASLANAASFSQPQPDSAKFKWIDGKKFMLHKVQVKDTWNIVARQYQLSISDLMKANLGVIDLKPGQILNIPVAQSQPQENNTTASQQNGDENVKYKTAVLYSVHDGETLYSISKKFNASIDDLKKWNNLENDIVKKDQKLVVSYISGNHKSSAEAALPPPALYSDNAGHLRQNPEDSKTVEVTEASVESNRIISSAGKAGGKNLSKVTETGICTWIRDADVNQNKFYALHRTAPTGTIIKITNKMNSQSVFVKVVGVLPDTGDNENSIIKISETAVRKLGALDAHFLVELSYGMTN